MVGPSDGLTRLYVRDADGKQLAELQVDGDGPLRGRELRLLPGETHLEVTTRDTENRIAYTIDVLPASAHAASQEVEPNDAMQSANRFDPALPLQGALGAKRDYDFFRFYVADLADQRSELRLDTDYSGQIELSLLDDTGNLLQRRAGDLRSLPDLRLPPGEYGLSVRAAEASDAAYTLAFAPTEPYTPGMEAEPNDLASNATPIDVETIARGRGVGRDDDYFVANIDGEPQRWRIVAEGPGVEYIAYHDATGQSV
ncbi:MAG: hypothetical protein HC802_22700, partial [Caldilineaceae bacterium]|nr:hypothetical protein [Caldilineaceae bacterium]